MGNKKRLATFLATVGRRCRSRKGKTVRSAAYHHCNAIHLPALHTVVFRYGSKELLFLPFGGGLGAAGCSLGVAPHNLLLCRAARAARHKSDQALVPLPFASPSGAFC